MVADVSMMLIPDPTASTANQRHKISSAFAKMKGRNALMFLSERRLRSMSYTAAGKQADLDKLSNECELDMTDRRELDEAVLEMLGVTFPQKRQEMIDELYAHLREFFEATRQKEEKAILNKNTSRRRGTARPGDIAAEIHNAIAENEPALLLQYEADFLDKLKPYDTYDLPVEGVAQMHSDMVMSNGVKFIKGNKTIAHVETSTLPHSELIAILANGGQRGLVRIPRDNEECIRVLEKYRTFIEERDGRIRELIQERTADEEAQEKILAALMALIAVR